MDDSKGLSDIDRALADALDLEVSPDFAARVRQRVANEPMRAPFWHGWRIALAAAAAIVLVATGVAMLSTRRPAAPPVLSARSLPTESARPAVVRPSLPVPSSDTRPAIVRARVEPGARAVSASREPEVLVPREEIEMYRRLIAKAQQASGALLVDAPPDIVAVRSITEIPFDPIRIDPIIPSVDGEGDRQ